MSTDSKFRNDVLPTVDRKTYYEQNLILNVPYPQKAVKKVFPLTNSLHTYVEECSIRGLLNENQSAKEAIHHATDLGYSLESNHNLAQ